MAIVYPSKLAGGGAAEGNAVQADVRSGKTFSNSSASGLSGSMTENTGDSHKLDGSNKTYPIPEGYHPGTGSVYIETEEKTGTANVSTNTVVTATSGKVMTKVTVPPLSHTAYNPSSTGFTYVSGGEEKEINLGENHNVRYVRVKGMLPMLQFLDKGKITPGHNWSEKETVPIVITPDDGYDYLTGSKCTVPMIRDNTLFTPTAVSTPSSVYDGDGDAQSNSQKLLRIAPTKDGMVYTDSYVYVQPNSYLGNAAASNVLVSGSMTDRTGWYTTGTAGQKQYIPQGYHDGNTFVQCPNGSSGTSVTPSADGTQFSSGLNNMTSGGYAYTNKVSVKRSTPTLWSNSSPTTALEAKTLTLSESLNNFDYLIFEYMLSDASNYNISSNQGGQVVVAPQFIRKYSEASGTIGAFTIAARDTDAWWARRISYVSATQLKISSAFKLGELSTGNNDKVILKYIYGLKITAGV